MHRPSELDEFESFSAQLGRDPLLTQGSSGNTSLKIAGRLWIKASGKWLANAQQEEMFLPLDLSQAKSYARQQFTSTATMKNLAGEDLQPSLDTPMHALLPQRVVVHVHSVHTLAYAVRSDAPERLKSLLAGLRWQWIPYRRSGVPLAQEIEGLLRRSAPFDFLILGNHGLVVCGDDCRTVGRLLKQVELRLGSIPRKPGSFDSPFLRQFAQDLHWQLPEHTRLHCLATDEVSRSMLANGSLYPCQAIVLGGPAAWRPFYSGLFSEAVRNRDHRLQDQPFLIVKDKGVLLSPAITAMQLEALIGLVEVVQRIDASAPVRYLTEAECEELAFSSEYAEQRYTDVIALSA